MRQRTPYFLVLLGLICLAGCAGTVPSTTQQSTPLPTAATFRAFPLPESTSGPSGMALGPDGSLWFTELAGNRIGRITPEGHITEFPLPTSNSQPFGITAGPDDTLWFTETGGNRIGRITPEGQITEFLVPTPHTSPDGMTRGPDGTLWFAEAFGQRIGRITPEGQITEFPLPESIGMPSQVVAGPDGNLWFTAEGGIGRMTPAGQVTLFSLNGDGLLGITVGPDGNLWFPITHVDIPSGVHEDQIGRITPAGQVTRFPLPARSCNPDPCNLAYITQGPERSLWFTEFGNPGKTGGHIGRITLGGQVTEFPVPTPGAGPAGITVGPDGALWFTEQKSNQIGQLVVSS